MLAQPTRVNTVKLTAFSSRRTMLYLLARTRNCRVTEDSLVGGTGGTLQTRVSLEVEVKREGVSNTTVDDETGLEVASAVGIVRALWEEAHVVLQSSADDTRRETLSTYTLGTNDKGDVGLVAGLVRSGRSANGSNFLPCRCQH